MKVGKYVFLFRAVIVYSMYSILAFCIQIGCLLHAMFPGGYYFSTEQSLSSWMIMSRKYLQLWDFSHSISISAQFEECTPHFDLWKRSVSYGNSCELHYVSKKALGLLKVKLIFDFLVAFIIGVIFPKIALFLFLFLFSYTNKTRK